MDGLFSVFVKRRVSFFNGNSEPRLDPSFEAFEEGPPCRPNKCDATFLSARLGRSDSGVVSV